MAVPYTKTVEDALFLQARSVAGTEFDDWVGNLRGVLLSNDRGPSCLTFFRQMYVLTAATKYRRNLGSDLYKQLMSIVLEPEQGSVKLKLIAATVLLELSPSKHIELANGFNPPIERASIPYFLPVLLAQSNCRDKISVVAPRIVEFVVANGLEEELSFSGLCALHSLCAHPRALELVEEEQLRAVSLQLSGWLKLANTQCLPPPTSGLNLFTGKKQFLPVKEIDGSPSQGIFTLLNLGGYYSTDQLLNISTFASLRRWLTMIVGSGGGGDSTAPTPIPDVSGLRSSSASSSLTGQHPPSSSSAAAVPTHPSNSLTSSLTSSLTASLTGGGGRSRHSLKDAAVQYCLRVVEQCERKPMKNEDVDLVNACLCECVAILDLLCSLSSSLVHTIFPSMRLLCSRVTQDPVANSRLLLVLLKFFVNHGESEMYDVEGLIDLFFGKVLSIKFNDSFVACEVVAYLGENVEILHSKTRIFTKFFPNILKILAWSPVTFVSEFIQLLPAFIMDSTVSEVFHSLLDLPCLSATLQAQHLLSPHSVTFDPGLYPNYAKCLAAFQDATYKLMFGHFLRSENGKGDTIDRLSSIHHLLLDFVGHERVKAVSRVAPLLLRVFFKVVLCGGEESVVQLCSVLLERIVLLYDTEPFGTDCRKIMADQLLLIFERYPHLVVDHRRDLLDYLGNLRTLSVGGEHCYMHLVWIVGKYCHSGCSVPLLNQYFGTLESVAYEISIDFHKVRGPGSKEGISVRLFMVLMSTIAKLASRCQDLIPRTLLCLKKIAEASSDFMEDRKTHRVLLNRANELVNVLKMPSLALAVLSPPAISTAGANDMERQTSITHLLQFTANHLNVK